MPQSLREQLLQALDSRLAPIAAAHGAVFRRAPVLPVTRAESPALLWFPESDTVRERTNDRVERELVLRLTALARGEDAALMADALLVAAHAALCAEPNLGGWALGLRELDSEWDSEDADATAQAITIRYELRYRTLAADLTRPG